MTLLRRLFERIPSQVIFWALFAWTIWKLFFLCARLYVMDMYFYVSLAVAISFVGLLLFSARELKYKLIAPALIAIELAIAFTSKK